ncbi:MAG: YjbH domain-containing protein [Nitrospirae bacterium]|nr:YjbH domain-containing protein [Nitrospirota bacterium]
MSSFKIALLFFAFLIVYLYPSITVAAEPAYWGGTGLVEVPTARVIEDGELRLGISHAFPYRWYYASIGYFPGLEINGRLTSLLNLQASDDPVWRNYGKFKDRAIDLKYQIFDESKVFPAIAVGLQDIQGTRLFPSKYIALSRLIHPFDITVGYGLERLKGPFGGVEVHVTQKLSLMAEYNPIKYEKDRVNIADKASSKINFGARFKIWKGLMLGLSLHRGENVGVMVNYSFTLGKPILPHKPDYPYTAPVDRRPLSERGETEPVEKIRDALVKQGFHNVRVFIKGKEIYAEFENTKYLSETKAFGRVLRTVIALSPEDIQKVHAISEIKGVPVTTVSLSPEHFFDFLDGKLTKEDLARIVTITTKSPDLEDNITEARQQKIKRLTYGIEPVVETFLNDPSGFIKYRAGIDLWADYFLTEGTSLYARYKIPVAGDIKTSAAPTNEHPVRSDIADYKHNNPRLEILSLNKFMRLGENNYARISAGYIEPMFAGIGGEALHLIKGGRLALGIEADFAKKRDPKDSFALKGITTHSVLGEIYWSLVDIGFVTRIEAGRFLAGDKGIRIETTRYFRGASVSFWYTITDTSNFSGYNRGYHDKGVKITIPARVFFDHDSKILYKYTLSPWTRDVGQRIAHREELYPMLKGFMPAEIEEHIEELIGEEVINGQR